MYFFKKTIKWSKKFELQINISSTSKLYEFRIAYSTTAAGCGLIKFKIAFEKRQNCCHNPRLREYALVVWEGTFCEKSRRWNERQLNLFNPPWNSSCPKTKVNLSFYLCWKTTKLENLFSELEMCEFLIKSRSVVMKIVNINLYLILITRPFRCAKFFLRYFLEALEFYNFGK